MNKNRSEQESALRGVAACPGVKGAVAFAIAAVLSGMGWAQPAVETGKLAATAAASTKAAPTKVAAKAPAAKPADAKTAEDPRGAMPVCSGDMPAPVSVDVVVGKSTLIKLPGAITLRTLADKEIAQARLLSPQTLYILGTNIGSTNMILQDSGGRCTLVDVNVVMDGGPLRSKLAQLMPDEKNITVTAAADTLVLSGVVADAMKVEYAMNIATAYVRYSQNTDPQLQQSEHGIRRVIGRMDTRVINMLSVSCAAAGDARGQGGRGVEADRREARRRVEAAPARNGDWTYGDPVELPVRRGWHAGAIKEGFEQMAGARRREEGRPGQDPGRSRT